MIKKFSSEKQVTKDTPPTFLFHTKEDKPVPVENSIAFHKAMQAKGRPSYLSLFEKGRHGIGLGKKIPGTNKWPETLKTWMKKQGYIK